MTDLERCLHEQRAARDYILSGGPDQRGAFQGLEDWVAEEILILAEDLAQGGTMMSTYRALALSNRDLKARIAAWPNGSICCTCRLTGSMTLGMIHDPCPQRKRSDSEYRPRDATGHKVRILRCLCLLPAQAPVAGVVRAAGS